MNSYSDTPRSVYVSLKALDVTLTMVCTPTYFDSPLIRHIRGVPSIRGSGNGEGRKIVFAEGSSGLYASLAVC